jgi:hypothetical protein
MIQEWYWAWTANVSDEAKPLGFARELARYKSLSLRNTEAWGPHLESSRQLIMQAAEEATGRELAVIAGSGWCLDVPLAELSQRFKKVLLVDAAHPLSVRREAARLGNVTSLSGDLTGCLWAVAKSLAKGERISIQPAPPALLRDLQPDLVVSVNTLAQLPLLPLEHLWTTGLYSDAELEAFARGVIEAHLSWLHSFGSLRCLLTDHAWLGISEGETLASDPLHGVRPPEPRERWEWRYAPKPEAHPFRDVVHIVEGSIF